MGNFKLTSVEEFEAATNRLLGDWSQGRRGRMAVSCEKSDAPL